MRHVAFVLVCVLVIQASAHEIAPVLVDAEATGYATFQSHNQKIVDHEDTLWMAYLRSRNEAYTAQRWRLARSTDGGATWQAWHEAIHATNPPVLEMDPEGNLYLVRADFTDGHAYLYRFLKSMEYRDPIVSRIQHGAAGKYAMMLDWPRRQLYFASHNGYFNVLGLDGVLRSTLLQLVPGPKAMQQYPLLSLDDSGTLHFAYTTNANNAYLYWDIHYLRSRDGAATWETYDSQPLSLPLVSDDAGPVQRLTRDDEFEVHTWLSSMAVANGKVHFAYLTQSAPGVQNYIRLNAADGTREIETRGRWGGEQTEVMCLDGFFTRSPTALYFTGSHSGRIVCLRSEDNGATWHDYAASTTAQAVYALGGCRTVTPAGNIVGAYTVTDTTDAGKASVYFISIPAAAAAG